jgi:hypothetical protein
MVMLEARVGGIDQHSADALWDYCYRVTPDEFHARDRHVRAKGAEDVKAYENFIRIWKNEPATHFDRWHSDGPDQHCPSCVDETGAGIGMPAPVLLLEEWTYR